MRFLSLTSSVVLLFLAGLTGAQERPNIVVIMTDDQASWTIGAYGNKECPTPNLDRLAREGARFTNAFTVTPVCSPSRASFFTGRYGTELGITDWINKPESDANVGIPDVPTWPGVLQKNGYKTALMGKWHLGEKPQFHPTKHGFDHFFGFLNGGQQAFDAWLEKDGKQQQIKGPIADVITTDALEFVDKHADKPFALCLFFREPHVPYLPVTDADSAAIGNLDPTIPDNPKLDPKHVKELTRRYYMSVHTADRNIGRLLAKLDELKLTDKTIVLFTSDHGYNIGQHTIYTKGNGAWIAGGVEGPRRANMFEESIRVPLLIRWPGVARPGMVVEDTVSNLDSFATVLGMTGVQSDDVAKQRGVDFSPLLRGQTMPPRPLFAQYDMHNGGFASMRMIRANDWKLLRFQFTNGLNELYDLKSDPGETKNLYFAPEAADKRKELQSQLSEWQNSINDPTIGNPLNTPGVGAPYAK